MEIMEVIVLLSIVKRPKPVIGPVASNSWRMKSEVSRKLKIWTSYLNNHFDFPSVFALVDIRNNSSEHNGKVSKAFVPRINTVYKAWHLKTRGKWKDAKASYDADCTRVK